MAKNKIATVEFRRKRQGKTDYKKRLGFLKSRASRLVIRKSNKNLLSQIVVYNEGGDKIESQSYSKELEKFGWKYSKANTPGAYLTGLLLGKKTGTKKAVLDIGLQKASKDSRLFACLKGCIDGGLDVAHSKDFLPSEDRIKGAHISTEIGKAFEDVKKKILSVKKQ